MTRVARPFRSWSIAPEGSRRRGRGAGDLEHVPAIVEAAGEYRGGERFEARLARLPGVERHQALGSVEQQRWRVAAAPDRERDLRAHPLQPGAPELVQRGELRGRDQRLRRFGRTCLQLGLCRGERSRPPACGIGGQLGRSLQESSRGCDAAATLRPVGGALQPGGDALVETDRRVGSMPSSPIGIHLAVRRLGQRAMNLPAGGLSNGPIDRRAHEWMPESHAGVNLDQPC